jgi:hypothetical protein
MPTATPDLFCAGDLSAATILLIGHDRRLRRSDALANAPFFADYFLQPVPRQRSDFAKYKLAEALFAYIGAITSFRYPASAIAITNLCNTPRRRPAHGKTVFISAEDAQAGVEHIHSILKQARIRLIFAMSQQVNYWLQELKFCDVNSDYLQRAAPRAKGIESRPPYYEPRKPGAFPLICGKRRTSSAGVPLYPIVHVRSWPFDSRYTRTYGLAYSTMISDLKLAG